MVASSVGLRRSEIDGYLDIHLCPRDEARLCANQFLIIQIVSSIIPLSGHYLRSESKRLVACSVGLRRSEIDGYFKKEISAAEDFYLSFVVAACQASVDAGGLMGEFLEPRF